jgi:hypothetical protein
VKPEWLWRCRQQLFLILFHKGDLPGFSINTDLTFQHKLVFYNAKSLDIGLQAAGELIRIVKLSCILEENPLF